MKVAYIWQQDIKSLRIPLGWYICDDTAKSIDDSGPRYSSFNAALSALSGLVQQGKTDYTHFRTGCQEAKEVAAGSVRKV